MARIEEAAKGTQCMQPPSLYVSVATPLEVWAIPDPSGSAPQTIFYKVPQVQECDSIIELPKPVFDAKEALTMMKAEPRMVRLLEKAGITLRRNYWMPPPPAICEEWWSQAEAFIKGGRNVQPKFALGYHDKGASDDEGENPNAGQVHCSTITATSTDGEGCSNDAWHQQQPADAEDAYTGEEIEAKPAPQELEDGGQPTVDELVEINLGADDNPRPTFVSATLTQEERESYRSFLMEYGDCFAWSYKEMPGLDPCVATHKLAIDPQVRPVKQPKRQLRPEFEDQVIAEVNKLITTGFIKEIQYPWWLSSIVPVEKKNGKARV
jgi:hypothetical protein